MNVVVIIADTLRRDHLGCYGNTMDSHTAACRKNLIHVGCLDSRRKSARGV